MRFKLNKINNKKAQIKMIENVVVLVIFLMLLIVGIVLYTYFHGISVKKTQKEFSQKELIELGQRVPYVPEIQCPTSLESENCLDLYKLEVFRTFYNDTAKNKFFYQGIFGFANLFVREIYPGNRTVNFYSISWGNLTTVRKISIPISVYNPETRLRSFAIMEVYKFG